ncbi:MAG: hypothetical protein LBR26_14985 [Prevotella sp.]|jgi:hypothetical protein|nr:hypothetical protein [Prevotella sp.]
MKPVLYGLIAVLFLCFGSCKNTDEEFQPDDVLPPVPDGYVRMQITVPGLTPVSTYALSSDAESKVSTVGVLVFGSDSKYLCYAAIIEPSKITGTGSTKTFDVYLQGANNASSAYVMVVTNASVDTLGFAASRPTKEAVMQSMTFDSPGKWPVDGSKTFPMWGMTDSPVSLAGASSIPSISLIRSVARIDVGLKFPNNVVDGTETATGLGSTFTLEEIYLYNSLNKGSVAPYSGKYSETTATAPSIPTSPSIPDINSAIPYLATDPADGFSANKSCMNAIYMAEHAAGTDALTNNPYLVIGGKYNGSGTVTYYRLDFVSGSYPSQTLLPVLRNHRYRFNITEVKGPGYGSVTAAAEARPVNLTYDLSATDESLTSYVYDGQYALGISQDSYILDNKARTGITLKVSTTYEKGYTAVSSNTSWLVITGGASTSTANSSGSPTTLTFMVTANTVTGANPRTETITITSGRLTKTVTVTQSNLAGFSVSDPTQNPYPTAGGYKTLEVTSSYDWRVNVTDDPNAIVTDFTSNGSGSGTFGFTLIDNSANYYIPSATFTFFSPSGEFAPISKTVGLRASTAPYVPSSTHNGWAGSNIYWDPTARNGAGALTFADTPTNPPGITSAPTIPETYQGVFFKWGSLIGVDPSYVNTYKPTGNVAWNGDCRVFVPTWNSSTPTDSYWSDVATSTVFVTTDGDDDTGAPVSPATLAAWENIPYVSAGSFTNVTTSAYLTLDADPDLSIGAAVTTPSGSGGHIPNPGVTVPVEKMKGDICRYLSQTGDAPGSPQVRWRLPRAEEFGTDASEYSTITGWTDWSNIYNSTTVNSFAGMYQPKAGYRKTSNVRANYPPWFPTNGYRQNDSGALLHVGSEVTDWSSSPSINPNAYELYSYGAPIPNHAPYRTYGNGVRCVKE